MSSHNQSAYKRFSALKMGVQEANAFLHMLVPAARAPALQQLVMCELQALRVCEKCSGVIARPWWLVKMEVWRHRRDAGAAGGEVGEAVGLHAGRIEGVLGPERAVTLGSWSSLGIVHA